MAHYNVVIETHPRDRLFRADVVKGPSWALGAYAGIGSTPKLAFEDAKVMLSSVYKQHTFDFIHAPA